MSVKKKAAGGVKKPTSREVGKAGNGRKRLSLVGDETAEYNTHTEVLRRIEGEIAATHKPLTKRRLTCWKLRVQGYTPLEIADLIGVHFTTVYNDIKWCQENVPSAIEGGKELLRVSLERLEVQYRQLAQMRENGDTDAQRLSISIIEAQSKLMGLYTARLELRQVNYTIEGVDMGNLV